MRVNFCCAMIFSLVGFMGWVLIRCWFAWVWMWGAGGHPANRRWWGNCVVVTWWSRAGAGPTLKWYTRLWHVIRITDRSVGLQGSFVKGMAREIVRAANSQQNTSTGRMLMTLYGSSDCRLLSYILFCFVFFIFIFIHWVWEQANMAHSNRSVVRKMHKKHAFLLNVWPQRFASVPSLLWPLGNSYVRCKTTTTSMQCVLPRCFGNERAASANRLRRQREYR